MSSDALDQASLGIDASGLGFRECADCALAAYVASCASTQALVERMCNDLTAAGLPGQAVLDSLLASVLAARAELLTTCDAAATERVAALLGAARARAYGNLGVHLAAADASEDAAFADLLEDMPAAPAPRDLGLVLPDVDEGVAASAAGGRLQRGLTHILDLAKRRALLERAEAEGRHPEKKTPHSRTQ